MGNKYLHYLALFLILTFLSGCVSETLEQRQGAVSNSEDVGSTHVTVLAVIPWNEISYELQPVFELTASQAVQQAIPTTADYESQMLDILVNRLSLSLPSSNTSSNSSIPTNGQARTSPFASGTAISKDPMMKYLAATALFQEVHLLNNYISKFNIDTKKYDPYVVRLQVSVMPKRRDLPYDAYLNIGFYADEGKKTENSSSVGEMEDTPIAIPLLVTDNLEAGSSSKSREVTRQFGLLISALVQGVGGSAEIQKMNDMLERTTNESYNSLLTVASISKDILRVRLGAVQSGIDQGHFKYTMIPRTHNISILLLVPKKTEKIALTTLTTYVDAISGNLLPNRSGKEVVSRLTKLLDKYGIPSIDEETVNSILDDYMHNNYIDFRKTISKKDPTADEQDIESVWIEIVSKLTIGGYHQYTNFTIPSSQPRLPPNDQTIVVDDDGMRTTARFYGVKNIITDKVLASLNIGGNTFIAQKIDLINNGIELSFPSLSKIGLCKKGGEMLNPSIILDYDGHKVAFKKIMYVPFNATTKG